jgi:hypothetical protein
MKKIKAMLHVLKGFVKDIPAFDYNDGTTFRTKLSGIYSSSGNRETWGEIIATIKSL